MGKPIEFYSETYENIIIMGDFNADISETNLTSFSTIYNSKSLINKHVCYKNSDNPSWIDLIFTNFPNYFQNLSTFEARLLDFRKLIHIIF